VVQAPPAPKNAPTSAAGFDLGAEIASLQKVCESAEKQWSVSTPDAASCSGPALDLGFAAQVDFGLANNRARTITLKHTPERWLETVTKIRRTLTEKYGSPQVKQIDMPEECVNESMFYKCMIDKDLRLKYRWTFGSGAGIEVLVGRIEGTEPPAIRIQYSSSSVTLRSQGF
jgi:hypothetical protein